MLKIRESQTLPHIPETPNLPTFSPNPTGPNLPIDSGSSGGSTLGGALGGGGGSGGGGIGSAIGNLISGSGSAGGSFNPAQLAGLVQKLGGIEGIFNTLNKLNKMMATVQQMSAMFKMLGSSFFSKSSAPDPPARPTTRRPTRYRSNRKRINRSRHKRQTRHPRRSKS
jgi:hypothetical protein